MALAKAVPAEKLTWRPMEGTRSFRVADPDGRQVAIFYHYPA